MIVALDARAPAGDGAGGAGRRAMRELSLETEIDLPEPPSVVFPFFADASNLEAITPPWLHFRILTTGPITMAAGTRIRYRLRLHGLPIEWLSEITAWEPPLRFVDRQVTGPYRLWIHEHTFEEVAGGTRVRDRVRYAVPGGRLVERLLVRPDLERIFAYRGERLRARFGCASRDA